MSCYGNTTELIDEGTLIRSQAAKDFQKKIKEAIKKNDIKLGVKDSLKKGMTSNYDRQLAEKNINTIKKIVNTDNIFVSDVVRETTYVNNVPYYQFYQKIVFIKNGFAFSFKLYHENKRGWITIISDYNLDKSIYGEEIASFVLNELPATLSPNYLKGAIKFDFLIGVRRDSSLPLIVEKINNRWGDKVTASLSLGNNIKFKKVKEEK